MLGIPGLDSLLGRNKPTPSVEELRTKLLAAEEDLSKKLQSPGGTADSFQWDTERAEISKLKKAIEQAESAK